MKTVISSLPSDEIPRRPATHLHNDFRRISALSGFGIVLVVIGHTQGATPTKVAELMATNPGYRAWILVIGWIYSFHMPLFMAISGYLYGRITSRHGDTSYGALVRQKAKRLLVPYIVISSLAFFPKAWLASFADRPLLASLPDYLHSLIVPWDNVIVFFWFLPTLFLCFLAAPLLVRSQKSSALNIVLLICGIGLWFLFPHTNREGYGSILNIGGALHNFIFFFAGYLSRTRSFTSVKYTGALAIATFMVSVLLYSFVRGIPLIQLALAFLGLVFSYAVVCTESLTPVTNVLANIGDYSFQIYLFSWFPMVFLRVTLQEILSINIWIVIALSAIFGLLLPILITQVLDRHVPVRARFLYGR